MRFSLRLTVAFITAAICSVAGIRGLAAHPLHTTLTELTYNSERRVVYAMIRVFVDDFGAAVSRHTGAKPATDHTVPAAAAFKYVASAFTLIDQDGRRLPLKWCGERRAGEVLFVCVSAAAPRGLRGMAIRNALMFDMFSDQVNIVQARDARRKHSLLFTRGDRPKRIP